MEPKLTQRRSTACSTLSQMEHVEPLVTAKVNLAKRLHTWLKPRHVIVILLLGTCSIALRRSLCKGRAYIFICVHLQKVIFRIAQTLPDKCPANSQYFHCGGHICHC